jgi:hypothetical protein
MYINRILKYILNLFVTSKNIWSISLYTGLDLHTLGPNPACSNPILSSYSINDCKSLGVADPFVIYEDEKYYLFFEVINRRNDKGKIGLACSDDLSKWTYKRIILSEPFHLSYPYVISHNNEYYMIPESGEINSIRLYKATNFPYDWKFICDILKGRRFCDTSLFYFNDQWWLYTSINRDTLLLFYSNRLTGPWKAHPKSPIIEGNPHIARPGGRVLVTDDGSIIRFAQDCATCYGRQVSVYKVHNLTNDTYEEEQLGDGPILEPGAARWNRTGMHHIDLLRSGEGRWLAFVDGYRIGLTRRF